MSEERRHLHLAAVASAAVRGLDPVGVAEVYDAERGHVAVLVVDAKKRRWLVEEPVSAVEAAAEDLAMPLLPLLESRLPFSVPRPEGTTVVKGLGRISVTPWIENERISFDDLPPGPGLAAELGRTLAAIHNLDPALYDEAGVPTYDAEAYRRRRLSELDRAAATGHVPTGLLTRWEEALELVPLWRFAATPVHGAFDGDAVRVRFTGDDASTGTITAVTSWHAAKVADPADDFAALYEAAHPETFDSVLEAYAQARTERPDRGLETRARLAAELDAVSALLRAHAVGDDAVVEELAGYLRVLDAETADHPLVRRPEPAPKPAPAAHEPAAQPPAAQISGAARPSASAPTTDATPGDPAPGTTGTAGGPVVPAQTSDDDLDATTEVPADELIARDEDRVPRAPGRAAGSERAEDAPTTSGGAAQSSEPTNPTNPAPRVERVTDEPTYGTGVTRVVFGRVPQDDDRSRSSASTGAASEGTARTGASGSLGSATSTAGPAPAPQPERTPSSPSAAPRGTQDDEPELLLPTTGRAAGTSTVGAADVDPDAAAIAALETPVVPAERPAPTSRRATRDQSVPGAAGSPAASTSGEADPGAATREVASHGDREEGTDGGGSPADDPARVRPASAAGSRPAGAVRFGAATHSRDDTVEIPGDELS